MCAASSLPRVRSAAVTWITRCCLLKFLTFDEFGNTKTYMYSIMYSNWGPICTLLMTHGVNIQCINNFKFNTFCWFCCGCCWFTETARGSARRCVFAFFWKSFPRNTSLFNAFFLTNCFISIKHSSKCVKVMAQCHPYRTMCIYVKIVINQV